MVGLKNSGRSLSRLSSRARARQIYGVKSAQAIPLKLQQPHHLSSWNKKMKLMEKSRTPISWYSGGEPFEWVVFYDRADKDDVVERFGDYLEVYTEGSYGMLGFASFKSGTITYNSRNSPRFAPEHCSLGIDEVEIILNKMKELENARTKDV